MLNSLLHLSTECKNETPFGKGLNISGTFAVILKSALNEITKEKHINFLIVNKDRFIDNLFMIKTGKKIKVCNIDGYSSVNKIRKAIEKKIGGK